MPKCFVYTNLKDVPEGFEGRLTKCVHETLNKPVERISVAVLTGLRMMKAGSNDPLVIMMIRSVAGFDEQRNPAYSEKFIEFLKKETELPGPRIGIEYVNIQGCMVANGKPNSDTLKT